MVDKKLKLDTGLIKSLKKIRENTEEESKSSNVILFFSYDIVNSSLYKTINYSSWTIVINKIFKYIDSLVTEKMPNCELWRILGDEAVYIVQIRDIDQIYINIDSIFEILCKTKEYLSSGEIFKNCKSEIDIEIMKMQNILSVKGSSWLAIVANDINAKCSNVENAYLHYNNFESIKNPGFFEFLGKDIDAGFRISKETRDRRLVLSFELAYILKMKTDYLSKLNLITFRRLKGIWHEKLYPIIWFHDREKFKNISFEESFKFDELEEDELSREYFNNRKEGNISNISQYIYEDINNALDKILEDRNLKSKIDKIYSTIEATSQYHKDFTNIIPLEMHCVAICYKVREHDESIQILVAKRSSRKKQNPSVWEFGCAKANYKNHIIDTIKNEYKEDFNIDIEPICYEDRDDKQPIPIAVYEIEKDSDIHKGVIFIAECKSDESMVNTNDKHEHVKWITEEEIEDFKDGECVLDFKNTVNTAFKKIKKMRENGLEHA